MSKENKSVTSIRIDLDLLARIDRVAADREQTRSQVMERICKNGIAEEERFLSVMENPVLAYLIERISRPEVMGTIAEMIGDDMDEEELERIKTAVSKQAELGRKRRGSRKRGRKGAAPEGT